MAMITEGCLSIPWSSCIGILRCCGKDGGETEAMASVIFQEETGEAFVRYRAR